MVSSRNSKFMQVTGSHHVYAEPKSTVDMHGPSSVFLGKGCDFEYDNYCFMHLHNNGCLADGPADEHYNEWRRVLTGVHAQATYLILFEEKDAVLVDVAKVKVGLVSLSHCSRVLHARTWTYKTILMCALAQLACHIPLCTRSSSLQWCWDVAMSILAVAGNHRRMASSYQLGVRQPIASSSNAS